MSIRVTRSRVAAGMALLACFGGSATAVAQATTGPTAATDITSAELEVVYEALGRGVDKQVKIVDIGSATNVAVGALRRGAMSTEGLAVTGIVHHDVTEVYYILEGSGTLVTGGEVEPGRQWPADSGAVTELVGPSMSGTTHGGHTRVVSAGDIVIIPAGVFHGFREIADSISYLSIRVDPGQVLPAGYLSPHLKP